MTTTKTTVEKEISWCIEPEKVILLLKDGVIKTTDDIAWCMIHETDLLCDTDLSTYCADIGKDRLYSADISAIGAAVISRMRIVTCMFPAHRKEPFQVIWQDGKIFLARSDGKLRLEYVPTFPARKLVTV